MTDKQTVKFGDICKEVKLTTKDPIGDGYERYIGLEHLDSGSLKIKRWGVIAEDSPSFTRVFKKGQILLGKRRPYLKKAAIAEFDGICSGDIIVIEKQADNLLGQYLPFLLKRDDFWEYAVKNSSGSLSPRTKFSALSSFVTEIPNEDSLQGVITTLEKLEEVVEKKESFSSAIETLIRSVLLKQMFPVLTGEPYKVQNYREAPMPGDYTFYKLGDIAKVRSGSTPLRAKAEQFFTSEQDGIPWVKTLDLNESIIESTEEFITQLALEECSMQLHQPGTVMLAMYGGFNQIGRTSILAKAATTNQAISAIICNEKLVVPEYCLLWLQVFRFLWKRYAASSRKDPNITKFDVENFPIWLPDLHKQKEILLVVENLRNVKEANSSITNLQMAMSNN
ncbi:restriction endonuclease subunit S [Vibrio alginolyticus]|uniref:restriction endonuclease subunit S n=1 Tax=Vibrio alginolyticus TaxID=663 RepID=UPI001EFE173D|nr:restriction endonuclease subunit S [Vibrio alginolyticus]MCG9765165.1 restriction endonuclease subunit S [Vibrio alginolyticus]